METARAVGRPDERKVEASPAEISAKFGNEVRNRLASGSSKDGSPAPRRLLTAGRIELATTRYRTWDILTEQGTPFEDVLHPGFWQHIARRISPGDQVTVRCDDGSYYAELLVLETTQLSARVMAKPGYPMLTNFSEPGVDASVPSGYAVKWSGEFHGYTVTFNGATLRDGFRDAGLAARFARDIAKTRARA